DEADDNTPPPISEVFVPHVIVRTTGKLKSFAWIKTKASGDLQILTATTNNEIETYRVVAAGKKRTNDTEEVEYSRNFAVDLPGHRTDIRSLALSSDDRMLASASNGTLKIWNVRTQSCLRTLDCGYSLCSSFLPGDKIVVAGNKNGELEVFDIASSTLLDTIKAHEGPMSTLQVHPDGKSMVTGSA
ncbi:hypothetical protein F66182_18712, partial [Fusarium sp. NRRL 66182]